MVNQPLQGPPGGQPSLGGAGFVNAGDSKLLRDEVDNIRSDQRKRGKTVRGKINPITEVTENVIAFMEDFKNEVASVSPAPYMQKALTNRQMRRRMNNMESDERLVMARNMGMQNFLKLMEDISAKGRAAE